MKRRSFFKSLLATAAAITVASAVEVFGAADKLVESTKKAVKCIVNPAYRTASYEDVFIFSSDLVKYCGASGKPNNVGARRYNDEGGKRVEVPYFKIVEVDDL